MSDALAYSQKHLVAWQETHLQQIQQLSGLLAFRSDTTCGPYKVCNLPAKIVPLLTVSKRLYDPSRWHTLAKAFRLEIYNLNTISTEPLLHLSLYAGLVALKTPACFDHFTKNVDCPVCDGESGPDSMPLGLGKLAGEVPYSHHSNSTIVCRISGKIMDEDNMPMAFPDGHVYSREVSGSHSFIFGVFLIEHYNKALEDMAKRNNGVVTCPRTGKSVQFHELRKVFIS